AGEPGQPQDLSLRQFQGEQRRTGVARRVLRDFGRSPAYPRRTDGPVSSGTVSRPGDEAMEALKNIALLIDADNASPDGIDPVLTVLAELGQVNIRRAYGNWAKRSLAQWSKITNRFGISPQQQFDLTKGKNATDMAMTIDAIDL